MGTPIITTVAEFGAAVQAIDALRHYSWDVTSLQEHPDLVSAGGRG